MTIALSASRLRGYRFPREIISFAVWAHLRFGLSLRNVEDLLAERGVIVSYEAIRAWVARFGMQLAAMIRRDRPHLSVRAGSTQSEHAAAAEAARG